MIIRIWGLNNYDYRLIVMFDLFCMGSDKLFGTEGERKIQNEIMCFQTLHDR